MDDENAIYECFPVLLQPLVRLDGRCRLRLLDGRPYR